MRCGTACFIVTIETDAQTFSKEIKARSQIDARKIAKKQYGESASVKSVLRKHGPK